jgi:acyl carrier protein
VSELDKDYEFNILKMGITKHLNEIISPTEEGLKILEADRDNVVWELATKIYNLSGHKVEFSIVRDIVDSRIVDIKHQLVAEEKERMLEQARLAEEKYRCDAEKERLLIEKDPDFHNKVTQVLGKFGGDEGRAKVFVRVRRIISEQLAVDESELSLDSHLSNYLSGDDMDLYDFVSALEEEFDIDITDIEAEKDLDLSCNVNYDGYLWSSSSLSSYIHAGEKCIVKNFVELIFNKI